MFLVLRNIWAAKQELSVPSAGPHFGLFTFALWFLQHPYYVTVFTHMYFPLRGIFPHICKESILKLIYFPHLVVSSRKSCWRWGQSQRENEGLWAWKERVSFCCPCCQSDLRPTPSPLPFAEVGQDTNVLLSKITKYHYVVCTIFCCLLFLKRQEKKIFARFLKCGFKIYLYILILNSVLFTGCSYFGYFLSLQLVIFCCWESSLYSIICEVCRNVMMFLPYCF